MPRSNRPKRRRGSRGPGGPGGHGSAGRSQPSGGPRGRPADPFAHLGTQEVEYQGQIWGVREVRGNSSGRSFRCPGCQQMVAAAEAHTVVWPTDGMGGMENRRHWHTRCWARRDRWGTGGSWA